jgi:radical SAM protein with 4Fe4S-binding SPASM domain
MPSLPLFERLNIETTALCNRDCWFCSRVYDRSGSYLDEEGRSVHNKMPTELVLRLLDEAVELGFKGRVGFHHYSEPLLDKRNLRFAGEARARGMRPCLVTNGDVLRDRPKLCKSVCEVYDHVVIGLYDYETDSELDAAKSYWRDRVGVAQLEFSTIGKDPRRAKSIVFPRALMPPNQRIRVPDVAYTNAPCHRPLVRLIVQHHGGVAFCCEDLTGAFSLGNVHQASLEQIWYSDRHVDLVRDLVAGEREKYELCRNCPATPTGPNPAGKKIGLSLRTTHRSGQSLTVGCQR